MSNDETIETGTTPQQISNEVSGTGNKPFWELKVIHLCKEKTYRPYPSHLCNICMGENARDYIVSEIVKILNDSSEAMSESYKTHLWIKEQQMHGRCFPLPKKQLDWWNLFYIVISFVVMVLVWTRLH